MDNYYIPKSFRKSLIVIYVFVLSIILWLYPKGAGEEYGKLIYYFLPLFAVSCCHKYFLMMYRWTNQIMFAILTLFYLILIPIEFGLRLFLVPDDKLNRFGQILFEFGILTTHDSQNTADHGWSQFFARFFLNAIILLDLAFLGIHLHQFFTHNDRELPILEIPDPVQPVRAHPAPLRRVPLQPAPPLPPRSTRRNDGQVVTGDSEFSRQFLERMTCDICADRRKEKRCRSCRHGMCTVCAVQLLELQNPALCPMCRTPLITEDLVLCRL